MTSIIEALQEYLSTYSGLNNAPVWVNYLKDGQVNYAIYPIAGQKIRQRYLNGGSEREFPFSFQTINGTEEDVQRLENLSFFEAFSDWLEAQTDAENFPNLGPKKTVTSIEALTGGYMYEQGDSASAVYQITCKLVYEQEP
jgi:hypothetical protein